jgi:hypothetical protein
MEKILKICTGSKSEGKKYEKKSMLKKKQQQEGRRIEQENLVIARRLNTQ